MARQLTGYGPARVKDELSVRSERERNIDDDRSGGAFKITSRNLNHYDPS